MSVTFLGLWPAGGVGLGELLRRVSKARNDQPTQCPAAPQHYCPFSPGRTSSRAMLHAVTDEQHPPPQLPAAGRGRCSPTFAKRPSGIWSPLEYNHCSQGRLWGWEHETDRQVFTRVGQAWATAIEPWFPPAWGMVCWVTVWNFLTAVEATGDSLAKVFFRRFTNTVFTSAELLAAVY